MSILDSFSLSGKVAIVTGTSTGLGQGMALGLAEAGADIVGVDYVDQVDTKRLIEGLGRKYLNIKMDLINSSVEELKTIVEQGVKAFGHVDILVNNAGIIKREDSLVFSEKSWDDVMNINLKTIFFLSQAFGNEVIKEGHGGKIVSICSMLSYQGGIRVPSYTASKSGLKGITMTLSNEWAKYNINVNAIAPGYMATNNTAALRDDEKRSGEILERIPAGRWGTPRDVAGAAVFLSSSASDYINGYTIAVDGGWLGR
ncbi:MAG: 2-dehydro-3-deoxy-D-gluconate 5-dehydrogenase KduD [Acholeplasmatales bacterium]|jgi:2-deoxy-D-gluconate 3-dehydrogenase|nr:2-dehydro-3-deoxy-D-gluconate 5-dehydrogenase KduD [Acholeplasmatales bacterium]